jgi:hypothetical protein
MGAQRCADTMRPTSRRLRVEPMEPISPELVLIDSQLARTSDDLIPPRARTEPQDDARMLRIVPPPARNESGVASAGRRASRLPRRGADRLPPQSRFAVSITTVISGALLLSGLAGWNDEAISPHELAADPPRSIQSEPVTKPRPSRSLGATSDGAEPPTRATPPRSTRTKPRTVVSKPAPATTRTARIAAKTSAEREVLAMVIRFTKRLPAQLIDPSTGLPRDDLQAICRAGRATSFACILRPVEHAPKEGLRVRYEPTRQGPSAFTWGRYRGP